MTKLTAAQTIRNQKGPSRGVAHGGYLKDHKGPRIRYWPKGKEPRPVRIKINSWVGISAGAKHVYVEIEEAHNPLWDEQKQRWCEYLDDERGRGRKFKVRTRFTTYVQAYAYVREMLRKHFGVDGHPDYKRYEFEFDNSDDAVQVGFKAGQFSASSYPLDWEETTHWTGED